MIRSISTASLALFLGVAAASAEKIVIKGSDTLGAKLVPQLAEAYKAANPGTEFSIAAEGSTTGLAAIIDGNADIGMSSRRAKPTEVSAAGAKNVTLTPTIVAYDAMVVVVNDKSPLKGLTKAQVEKVFTGEVSDWSAVGGAPGKISIYTRNTSSGTYSDFKDLAMKKRDYASSSQKMAGNEQIAAEVAKNANGIGYVGLAYLSDPGITTVSIEGSLPSEDSVLAGKYPYSRPTFYYTNGEATGEAANFLEFTLSDAGQKVVRKVGFVPVRRL